MHYNLSLLLLALAGFADCYFFHRHRSIPLSGGDVGEPLLLTPYIESGRLEEGRKMSRVCKDMDLVESYTGLFTVDKEHGSNMFFWYFPAEKKRDSAPLVIWLNGGPGASSTIGLFTENGPLYIDSQGVLRKRELGKWSKDYHVVYYDNPVGTGFSFTRDDEGFARNQEDVGKGLRAATEQFLRLFPELESRELYITGESYAGKYVPAFADALRGSSMNLKGIALGNGYTAPEFMLNYGEYLYQIGLLDEAGKEEFQKRERDIKSLIEAQDWAQAFQKLWSFVVGGGLFKNLTGYSYHYNFLHYEDDSPFGSTDEFLQRDQVRKCIHVGNLTFHTGQRVQDHLEEDFPQSMRPVVERLLEETRVMIYNGQLDIIVAYPLTENFLKHLQWSGSQEYKGAERKQWYVNGKLAGYSKVVRNLTEVLVRNAGHMVPTDQPVWALDMITRFINNKPF